MSILKIKMKPIFLALGLVSLPIIVGCSPFEATKTAKMVSQSELPGNVDGAMLYKQNCASCHGDLGTSAKRDRTAVQIDLAIAGVPEMKFLDFLNGNERFAIANALSSAQGINCDNTKASFVNINRINRAQYDNIIRDLTGVDSNPSSNLPEDASVDSFTNIAAPHGIDQLLAEQYLMVGENVLEDAFTNHRDQIVTCNPVNDEQEQRNCALAIISAFGLKAFRRPLSSEELASFVNLYETTRGNLPAGTNLSIFDESLKAPLLAMLVSPNFLFQIISKPVDLTDNVKALNGYELANRLSFTLWGSIPDSQLFAAAADDSILTPSVLDQQIDRMLMDPRAQYLIDSFASQWFKLDELKQTPQSTELFPTFTDDLKQAMLTETKLLLRDIIIGNNSSYLILESNYSYLNQALANHYGINGISGSQFRRVSLENTGRSGLITHGSVLSITSKATETSIVQRGLYLLENILCTDIAPAPAVLLEEMIAENGPLPTNPRELALLHSNDNRCASCHSEIDPAGLGLENFGPVGQFRTSYGNGDTIDASGAFPGSDSFSNYQEMSKILGSTSRFKTCVSRKLMTFALGRILNVEDTCSADTIGVANVNRDKPFKEVLKGVIMSDQYRKQKGE